MDDPVDGVATVRAHANVVLDPHLLQGLRPGRLPGRVRRRARSRSPRALRAVSPAVRRLERRPGRRHRLAARPRPELLERVERAGRRARPRGRGPAPTSGSPYPRRRATSCGSPLGERTADFAAAADELGHRGTAVRRRGCPGLHRRDRGQRPGHRAGPGLPALRGSSPGTPGSCRGCRPQSVASPTSATGCAKGWHGVVGGRGGRAAVHLPPPGVEGGEHGDGEVRRSRSPAARCPDPRCSPAGRRARRRAASATSTSRCSGR